MGPTNNELVNLDEGRVIISEAEGNIEVKGLFYKVIVLFKIEVWDWNFNKIISKRKINKL